LEDDTMRRTVWLLWAWLAGCSSSTPALREDDTSSKVLAELESLPIGLEVVHTPGSVGSPKGPNQEDWPYRWRFRTELRAIDRPITITRFGILAWDGSKWFLPPDQRQYNAGILDQATFTEWYRCTDATIQPGQPAVDPENWAGSYARAPFRQKWFFIGEDTQGQRLKGEGVVDLITGD